MQRTSPIALEGEGTDGSVRLLCQHPQFHDAGFLHFDLRVVGGASISYRAYSVSDHLVHRACFRSNHHLYIDIKKTKHYKYHRHQNSGFYTCIHEFYWNSMRSIYVDIGDVTELQNICSCIQIKQSHNNF